ncbi:hypothetical protein CHKEEEPN_4802 [Methylorubrum podarium]|nr:hypothetical protein CHKEEEPN_4802 [Methylorubrum podarium]
MVVHPARRGQQEGAPERHAPVVEAAGRPVVGGRQVGGDAGAEIDGLAPVARLDMHRLVVAAQDRVVAEGRHDQGLMILPEPGDGRAVEMVVVVVGDQHRVDRRQVGIGDARRIDPLRSGEAERAGTPGEDRIDQDVAARDLDQIARMPDQHDAEPLDPRRRPVRREGAREAGGPRLGLAGPAPAGEVAERLVRGLVRGVEAQAVEVVARRPAVIGVLVPPVRGVADTAEGHHRGRAGDREQATLLHTAKMACPARGSSAARSLRSASAAPAGSADSRRAGLRGPPPAPRA